MADIFHKQLLFSNEIVACKKASHFAYLAKDTFNAIFELDKSSSAYILQNRQEKAENILKEVRKLYLQNGYFQNALQSSIKLMYMYVQKSGKLHEAKNLIDEYDSKSNMFGNKHELSGPKRLYYSYKGQYYEGINDLDSAEFFYRKAYFSNMSYVAQDPIYRGLLSIFTKRHQPDSIAKYSRLYCEANDSSIVKKDQKYQKTLLDGR